MISHQIIFGLFLAFIIIFFGWPFLENRCIYFPDYPTRKITREPRELGLIYEDVFFTTADGIRLNGWWVPSAAEPEKTLTVLIFHGNAGNIGDRLELIQIFHDLGLNVFVIDYRGYGLSGGKPSEAGLYLDSQAACIYLTGRPGVNPRKIILYGESLGAAVAFDLAARVEVAAVITEGAFTSVPALAADVYHLPFLKFLVRSKYDSLSKVEKVTSPILLFHGRRDTIAPPRHGQQLRSAARSACELVLLEGNHIEAVLANPEEVKEKIKSFFKI